MANLHRAALGFEPSPGFFAPEYTTVYPYQSPFVVFSDAGDRLLPPPRRSVYEKGMALVEHLLASLPSREPVRLIHGDLHGWNVKINVAGLHRRCLHLHHCEDVAARERCHHPAGVARDCSRDL